MSPATPAVSCLCRPHPPDPRSQSALPGGKGETKVISCKGLRPLHPQHLTACGTYRPCRFGAQRGVCPVGRLPTLPPTCLPAPIPPSPFPVGRGRLFTLFRRGLAPPAPLRLNPGGTGGTCEAGTPRGASHLASPDRDSQCRTGTSRIQNPQQKRLSRFCKTQNPSRHPIQQGNHRSGRQRKSPAK